MSNKKFSPRAYPFKMFSVDKPVETVKNFGLSTVIHIMHRLIHRHVQAVFITKQHRIRASADPVQVV